MSVPVGKQFAEKASRFFLSPLGDDGMGNFSGGEITTPLPITGEEGGFRPSMVTRNRCSPSRCPVFEAGQAHHHGDFTLLILREKKRCDEE